jgi:hypothetical protein
MIFPKGQVVYENLNTAYTQFDAMLADLQSNRFTGYIKIVGWQYEGVLLLDGGGIMNAVDEIKGERRSGTAAADEIVVRAREKDSTISVYRLNEEMAQVLSGLFNGEAIYRDLESDFTSLDKLLAKLQAEKHSGYIEVNSKTGPDAAIIFMRDGRTVESLRAKDGAVLSGVEALPQILQTTATSSALFTVYRTDPTGAYRKGTSLADSFSRQEVLSFWQTVFKQVEMTIDQQAGPETFATALKRACIAQAEKYNFLDPFAAEFEYANGEVKFEGQASLAELNQGLVASFAQTVRELAGSADHPGLIIRLRPVAEQIKSKYGRLLSQVGLDTELPEVFAVV